MYCDLHVHTHFSSDSLSVPEEVMPLMAKSGCMALAGADHDALEAIDIFQAGAADHGLEYISGVEIDAQHPQLGHMHLLGYGFDHHDLKVREICAGEVAFGAANYEGVLGRFIAEGLIDDRHEFETWARGDWPRRRIGHKQLMRWLVHTGAAEDLPAGTAKYKQYAAELGLVGHPPHVKTVIDAVKAAGGVVVIAHPAGKGVRAEIEKRVDEILSLGAIGLEAYTPSNHSDENIKLIADIARDRGVIATGGSDHHGPSTIERWPSVAPYECFEALKAALDGS